MKNSTARQIAEAIYAKPAPAVWVVRSTYTRGGELSTQGPMTYRMACATARAIREACGYATVERIGQ